MNKIDFTVINSDGINLFHIDYVPPIGSTLVYTVDWRMIEFYQNKNKGTGKEFNNDIIQLWKSIDNKYWTVKDVYCEVRNYSGKSVPVHFVEVIEKEK